MSVLDLVRYSVGGFIAAIGFVVMAAGAVGMWRLPDFYTRLHAVGLSVGPGATLVIAGLAVAAPDWGAATKLILLAALIASIAPMLLHSAGNAAYGAGLTPVAGRDASRVRAEQTP
ncbi:MAG: monovalent cation/H(+) antiporter subunit G [Alphaproteobacteria bacterium]